MVTVLRVCVWYLTVGDVHVRHGHETVKMTLCSCSQSSPHKRGTLPPPRHRQHKASPHLSELCPHRRRHRRRHRRACDAGSWLLLGVPVRRARTARAAARVRAARTVMTVMLASTQHHHRAPTSIRGRHPSNAAPTGTAAVVLPSCRRRTASSRSACDPARADSSDRSRRPPSLSNASRFALRRPPSRRHLAQPSRPCCRPQRLGRVHGRRWGRRRAVQRARDAERRARRHPKRSNFCR